jgi:hypothetical protein
MTWLMKIVGICSGEGLEPWLTDEWVKNHPRIGALKDRARAEPSTNKSIHEFTN